MPHKEAYMPHKEVYMTFTDDAVQDVLTELARADAMFPPFYSAHDGYAIIHEELDELWDEVKKRDHDMLLMRKEAVQVAAMAIKFIRTVCDKGRTAGERFVFNKQ